MLKEPCNVNKKYCCFFAMTYCGYAFGYMNFTIYHAFSSHQEVMLRTSCIDLKYLVWTSDIQGRRPRVSSQGGKFPVLTKATAAFAYVHQRTFFVQIKNINCMENLSLKIEKNTIIPYFMIYHFAPIFIVAVPSLVSSLLANMTKKPLHYIF